MVRQYVKFKQKIIIMQTTDLKVQKHPCKKPKVPKEKRLAS